MSYTALYRKFRPNQFGDVKGQDHIVTALKNQIKADRIGHAYLFCGTRGTGKTTVAKIFAKAVNCEHPVDGNPCNECSVCKAINEQSSLNVIEIDAASNNGVDNIRQIVEEVQYSPTEGRYKVYIIDEVHMLSIGAFNALLKTLEEPPSYVIFILATTEAHKLPVTILSRCQRYDFKRIQVETIVSRLQELTVAENIQASEKALTYIAKCADGALRDALSLLDQCNAFYMNQELTYEKVLDVLGAVDNEVFVELFDLVSHGRATKTMEKIDELIMDGRDISQFVLNFTWFLRNMLLIKTTSPEAQIVDLPQDIIDKMRVMSVETGTDVIVRYIRVLSELSNQIKFATQKRVIVEMAFIKLCRPQMENDNESLINRIEMLERKLANGVVAKASEDMTTIDETKDLEKSEKITKEQAQEILKALPEEVMQVVQHWDEITRKIEEPTRHILESSKPAMAEGARINLAFSDDFNYHFMKDFEEHINLLKNAVFSVINKDVDFNVIYAGELKNSQSEEIVDLRELVNSAVEIEYDE